MKKIKKKKTSKTKVFSNYPIYDKKFGASLFWDGETINYHISDSLIIIDEAYRYYSSRKWQKFTTQEHTFFATNGHNNNDIIFIVHGINRLDPVIREMADAFFYIKKVTLPFMKRPLYFKIEVFNDEFEIAQRYSGNSHHGIVYKWFKKRVANAYNTHFFREIEIPDFKYLSWSDLKDLKNGKISNLEYVEGEQVVKL